MLDFKRFIESEDIIDLLNKSRIPDILNKKNINILANFIATQLNKLTVDSILQYTQPFSYTRRLSSFFKIDTQDLESIIVSSGPFAFKFSPTEKSVILSFPPVFFDKESIDLLKGIIEHELVHAYHFIQDRERLLTSFASMDDYSIDPEGYVSNYSEATALAQQVRSHLKEIPDKDMLLNLLKSKRDIFGGRPDDFYLEIIKNFINSASFQEYVKEQNPQTTLVLTKIMKIINNLVFRRFVSIKN